MKGIVFNVLKGMVEVNSGIGAWDEALMATEVDGAYTTLGSYPDEELVRIVDHLAKTQGISSADFLNKFGRHAFRAMMESCRHITSRYADSRSLLRALNEVIHPEVRKLYPDSETPDFRVVGESTVMLELEYMSQRSLCSFAVGMAAGAIDYFQERAHIQQPRCRLRGDSSCRLRIDYLPIGEIQGS